MKSIFLCLLIILLMNCRSTKNENIHERIQLARLEKQVQRDNLGYEDFNSFLELFKTDSIFQLTRTDTPFVSKIELVTVNAYGDVLPNILTSSDKEIPNRNIKKELKSGNITFANDSAFVTVIDTILNRAVLSKYVFHKPDKKWHLKTIRVAVTNNFAKFE